MRITFLLALANSFVSVSALRGGYKDACWVSFLYDHGEMYGQFAATCWTDPGDINTYRGTTIDLNHCLVNRHGLLGWGPK